MKKNWYKSKSVWSALIILALSVYQAYTGLGIPAWIYTFFAGLGLLGVRDAMGLIWKK